MNGSYHKGVIVNQEVRVLVTLENAGTEPVPLAGLRLPIDFNRTLNLPIYDYGNTRILPVTAGPLEFIVSCYSGSRFHGNARSEPSGNANVCAQLDAQVVEGVAEATSTPTPALFSDPALPRGGLVIAFLGPTALAPGASLIGGGPNGALLSIRHLTWSSQGDQDDGGMVGGPTCSASLPLGCHLGAVDDYR